MPGRDGQVGVTGVVDCWLAGLFLLVSPPQLTLSEFRRICEGRYCFVSAIFVVRRLATVWNIKN